jgi:hypothetical protein
MKKVVMNGLAVMLMALILIFSCKKKEPEPKPEENSYGSGNGMVTFYLTSDLGVGNIAVSVDGQSRGTITQFHSGGVTCGSGNVNVTLSQGTHSLHAVSQTGAVVWNDTFDIDEGSCLPFELTYSGGGGTTTGGTTTGGSTTGGTTTGGTTTGGTTTGGACASMNSYISFVSVVYNSCTNNSGATFTFKNNSSQKLEVKVPIKLNDGTWSCQYASPNAGATFSVWACNTTTTYGTIKSMLYSDWINNCTFGSGCP